MLCLLLVVFTKRFLVRIRTLAKHIKVLALQRPQSTPVSEALLPCGMFHSSGAFLHEWIEPLG